MPGDNPRLLSRLLFLSMKDFTAAFRALLHIKNQPIPGGREPLFRAVTDAYNLKDRHFERVLAAYRSGSAREIRAIFPAYAGAIKELIDIIDQTGEGKA